MSNDLDRDYSDMYSLPFKYFNSETGDFVECKVLAVEYDIGITIVDNKNHPVICLRNDGAWDYDEKFKFVIDLVNDGCCGEEQIESAFKKFYSVEQRFLTEKDCPFN